jgi:hypothetical protein
MVSNDKDFDIIDRAIFDNRPQENEFCRMMTNDKSTRFLLECGKLALEQDYKFRKYSRKVYNFKKKDLFIKITDKCVEEYRKKIIIINNILIVSIKNYWKDKNSYENIINELDALLWKPTKSCNCRNIKFGFCFHR